MLVSFCKSATNIPQICFSIAAFFACSIPSNPDWDDPWSILLGDGSLMYLALEPSEDNTGTYYWTDDYDLAQEIALKNFVSGPRSTALFGLPMMYPLQT